MASALNWGEGDKAKKGSSQPPSLPKRPSEAPKNSIEERKKESLEQIKKPPSPPPIHPAIAATHGAVTHSVPPALPKRRVVRRPAPSSTAQVPPIEANELQAPVPPSPKPEVPSPTKPSHLPVRPPRRTGTPANVPLPESRPHTPPVLIASQPSSPSIPLSTSTPPPLPRRAAARAPRQPNVNGSLSRSATPAPSSPPAAETRTGGEQDKPTVLDSRHLEEAKKHKRELLTTSPPTDAEAHPKPESAGPILNKVEGQEDQQEAGTTLPPAAAEANTETRPKPEVATSGPNDVEVKQEAAMIPSPTVADPNTETHPKKAEVATSMPIDGASTDPPEKIELLPDGVMSPASSSATSDAMFDAKSNPSLEDVVLAEPKGQGDESTGKESAVEEVAKAAQNVGSEVQDVGRVKEEHGDGGTKESGEGRPEKDARKEGQETATKLQIETKTLDGAMKPVEEETKPDEDKSEIYVGDATWEERAWKEIVRLKEEMFWARLGGLRQ